MQQSVSSLADAFAATGYVELTEHIPQSLRLEVAAHAAAALDSGGRRRDIRIGVTGDSPRRYRLAGRSAIEAAGDCIPKLYRSDELHPLLSEISGAPVFRVPYAPEEYVATRFEEIGDTHGWHWDDYSLALIWVTAAPDEADGGSLEFIPGVAWDKANPRVTNMSRVEKSIDVIRPPEPSICFAPTPCCIACRLCDEPFAAKFSACRSQPKPTWIER